MWRWLWGLFLSRFAGQATGIDVSNETINLAAKKYTKNNLGYLCVDPNEWGLPKSAFDFVTCFEVFEHINQPELLLEKIHYCLKPGGKLIISTPNKNVFGENIKVSFHVKEYTMEEFTAILQNIFDICEIKGQYHLKKIGRKWNYFISDLAMRFPVLLKIVSYYLSKKPRKYLNPEYFDHLDTSDNIFSKHASENADYFVVVCSKGT